MKKEFIPHEQALELKELGFNEPCIGYYRQEEVTIVFAGNYLSDLELTTNFDKNGEDVDNPISAPLYQQAFRWFRKEFKWAFQIQDEVDKEQSWGYWINGTRYINTKYENRPYFNTYEEAELACLKKLIEIAKQN